MYGVVQIKKPLTKHVRLFALCRVYKYIRINLEIKLVLQGLREKSFPAEQQVKPSERYVKRVNSKRWREESALL